MLGVLGGCNAVLLAPAGDVAVQQRNLLIASTGLMLIIILPVMALTLFFAWHYRASNESAAYDPDWHHSTALEVVIWSAPLLIIIALGALTWMGTHLLDPYRPIDRIDAKRTVADGVRPLTVEVVALDWKWLFIYPDQGIATVNELAAPVDVPISFRITSSAVMNSFFIPALAGQIYAMPGMETKLHAVVNEAGVYDGFSANYSGAGFSHMDFKFHGLSRAAFDEWVAKAKGSGSSLDRAVYAQLQKPSEAEPVHYYASVESGLYDAVLNLCTAPGKMCMNEMMHIDATGGGGRDSETNRQRLIYDGARLKEGNEAPGATFPASGRPPNTNVQPQGMRPDALSPKVSGGAAPPDQHRGPAMPDMNDMPGSKDMPEMKNGNPAPAQMND